MKTKKRKPQKFHHRKAVDGEPWRNDLDCDDKTEITAEKVFGLWPRPIQSKELPFAGLVRRGGHLVDDDGKHLPRDPFFYFENAYLDSFDVAMGPAWPHMLAGSETPDDVREPLALAASRLVHLRRARASFYLDHTAALAEEGGMPMNKPADRAALDERTALSDYLIERFGEEEGRRIMADVWAGKHVT